MPEEETGRCARDLEEGKSPSTAAGQFVHRKTEHRRAGTHGAACAQLAVANRLSRTLPVCEGQWKVRVARGREVRGENPNFPPRRMELTAIVRTSDEYSCG